MPVVIKVLGPGDENVLAKVAPEVFDDPIDPQATRAFLADPRHHLAVAIDDGLDGDLDGDLGGGLDGGTVVGFASAVHHLHPDKPHPELWINEVAVAPSHRRRGLARAILRAILKVGLEHGCKQAWVLTERPNTPALRLYAAAGGSESPDEVVMVSFELDE